MKKHYTITLTGRVKELSFMRFTEDLCKRLFGHGIIYDVGYYETKVLCETEEAKINEFCRLAKESEMVTETNVEEGLQFPRPARFVVPV